MAATRHIGTIRITASGSVRLSYCAARTRNTNTTASTKANIAVLPALICWKASVVHSLAKPSGSVRGRELVHDLNRLALRIAGRGGAIDLGGGIEVVARNAVRAGDVGHGGEGAERNRVAVRVAHADFQHIADMLAVLVARLRGDAEGAAEQVEVVDVGRADEDLQRVEHVRAR